eukprot:7379372-Alexandrium_andersonii.AAC.1
MFQLAGGTGLAPPRSAGLVAAAATESNISLPQHVATESARPKSRPLVSGTTWYNGRTARMISTGDGGKAKGLGMARM